MNNRLSCSFFPYVLLTQNLIELYASLDHRAFEFLVQHISLQLLVFLTRAKYFGRVPSALPSCNAASNKTVVLDQPSASQSSAQTPETRKRYRRYGSLLLPSVPLPLIRFSVIAQCSFASRLRSAVRRRFSRAPQCKR